MHSDSRITRFAGIGLATLAVTGAGLAGSTRGLEPTLKPVARSVALAEVGLDVDTSVGGDYRERREMRRTPVVVATPPAPPKPAAVPAPAKPAPPKQVKPVKPAKPAKPAPPPAPVAGSGVGALAVAEARKHIGKPYSFGASGPSSFDCSGLIIYVYGKFGVRGLPHGSNDQKRFGAAVPAGQARPGDLVFFDEGGYSGHVGIYVGGGQLIHAPSPGQSVKQERIWSSNVFYKRLV